MAKGVDHKKRRLGMPKANKAVLESKIIVFNIYLLLLRKVIMYASMSFHFLKTCFVSTALS